jgi:excisionase family DNA binding protein
MEDNKIVLYDVNDLIEILKVTRVTVIRYIKQKKIRAFKVGHGWRVTKEAMDEFIRTSEKRQSWPESQS